MEPRIQYAKTEDGVSIAYSVGGEGSPLVRAAVPGITHAQRDWTIYEFLWEPLTHTHRLVFYDSRGTGLSDRDAADFSLAAMELDLQAVVDSEGLETFAIATLFDGAQIGVTYAATHPERVSHLILVDGSARWSETTPTREAGNALVEGDWRVFTETLARVLAGIDDPEWTGIWAEHVRACCEPDNYRRAWRSMAHWDVSELLSAVRASTLVVQNERSAFRPPSASRELAAGIPGARLAVLSDPLLRGLHQLIEQFLGESAEPKHGLTLPEGTAIILFADIADSTALTERLGDAAFRTKATGLDGLLRKLIREADGTPVEGKVLGDGVMAVFSSARGAIDCALRCRKAGDEGGLPLHLGIHAGDVIREGNTVYGGAVNIAQRVADACPAGEVFVSDTVRSLARTSTEVGFEDRGQHELKGIPEPQRLFAVRDER